MDCIFCKIIKGDLPSIKIYEDEKTLAFLDINPVNPGHTLLVPKEHHENYVAAPDSTLAHMAVAAKKVSKAVLEATGAEGCNISVNNGAAAGQIVMHLHWHIIPRTSSDKLQPWRHLAYKDVEAEDVGRKIREKLV